MSCSNLHSPHRPAARLQANVITPGVVHEAAAIETLQADLDVWFKEFYFERTHQGRLFLTVVSLRRVYRFRVRFS
jgi:hypothetical protein